MKACVCSCTFSILVDGNPTKEIPIAKGLRQRDPFALFLFLITTEGLSGLMHKAIERGSYSPVKVGKDVEISLLKYTDDTILIGHAKSESHWAFKTAFELVTDLKINFHKSNIIGVNVEDKFLLGVSKFLFCSFGQVPFKFLGLPIGANPRRA